MITILGYTVYNQSPILLTELALALSEKKIIERVCKRFGTILSPLCDCFKLVH